MPKRLVKSYSRRHFLGVTAASTLALNYLPSRVFGANDRLQFAGIGVGGKGSSDIDHAGNFGDVVALCDCDLNSLNAKGQKFDKAQKFYDYRVMLDRVYRSVDAVTISTADHTHACAALMAMHLGKHVYVQKPLTHSVWEARQLKDTARRLNLCTQMGNQGTAENGLRRAVEIIQAGVIGPVREAHVWTNRPVWPQAPGIVARPTDAHPVPPGLYWDQFLGPAPDRPYHPVYHPFKWRGWWDFGTGALGDMACHTANMAFMALKLGWPDSVEAQSGELNSETYPAWATVTSLFPARGDMPPVKFVWYEGKLPSGEKNLPPKELMHGETPPGSGSLLVGDKGVLYSPNDYGAQYKLFPQKDFEGYKGPAESLPRNGKGDQGMKEEWVQAIKAGKPHIALSNFDYAATLTEATLLGNVAIRAQKKIEWDGKNLTVKNDSGVSHLIKRDYRPGWFA